MIVGQQGRRTAGHKDSRPGGQQGRRTAARAVFASEPAVVLYEIKDIISKVAKKKRTG